MTTQDFAWQHRFDDPVRLLLGKAPEGVDMRLVAQQIEGWQTARHKWPSLAANPRVLYPPRLNREQASSEATAAYKASLVEEGLRVADLTGGMGIDTMALARVAENVDYFEVNPALCDLVRSNAATLGLANITVHNGDSLACEARYDFALIDPARRDAAGRRVAAFEDCTPDILAAMPRLRQMTSRLMIKASPMVDISQAFAQLPPVAELHIVAVRGECKELLFILDLEGEDPGRFDGRMDGAGTERGRSNHLLPTPEVSIHCVNLQGGYAPFVYRLSEARAATAAVADAAVVPCYLYEPDATIMKAGCHALVASRFGLAMLSHNSHIYCSMQRVDGFPGRCFEVIAEVPPTRRALAQYLPGWKANIISRNHPLAADALRRQLRLADGGDRYLIATTFGTRPTAFVILFYV